MATTITVTTEANPVSVTITEASGDIARQHIDENTTREFPASGLLAIMFTELAEPAAE